MEIFACSVTLVIGITLGMMGGGGSIFALSVLVYLLKMAPAVATAHSLFMVGFTCLFAGAVAYGKGETDKKAIINFGVPSVIAVLFARHFLLPIVPEGKQWIILLLLAILMLAAAVNFFIAKQPAKANYDRVEIIFAGFLTGILTGLSGAGSGFIIVPILVSSMGIPVKKAIGSSLLIIAATAITGFLSDYKAATIQWDVLLPLTILAIIGSFIGLIFSNRIQPLILKRIMAFAMLFMAIFIFAKICLH